MHTHMTALMVRILPQSRLYQLNFNPFDVSGSLIKTREGLMLCV